MTTKHLISLLSRHEHLRTPANFRHLAQRVAVEMAASDFNPRTAERLLEVAPLELRSQVSEQIVMHAQRECRLRRIKEPKGGISARISKTLERIQKAAKQAQQEFDAALGTTCAPAAEDDATATLRRA
jgi:hypothetical protein